MAVDSVTNIGNRHDFTRTYTNRFDSNQTNLSIASPSGFNKLVVTGVHISVAGIATTGSVKLSFAGEIVGEVFAGSQTSFNVDPVIIKGASSEDLKLNSTLGNSIPFLVMVNWRDGV